MASREDSNPALGKSYGAELARHAARVGVPQTAVKLPLSGNVYFLLDSILPFVTAYCHNEEQGQVAGKTGYGHTRPHTGRGVRTAGGASRPALFA
jgi:hypothetical protein